MCIMKITVITASKEEIRFALSESVSRRRLSVAMFSPALLEEAPLCSLSVTAEGDFFTVSRRIAGRDGAYLCYTVADETGDLEGARYVSDMGEARYSYSYPAADSKKGLQVTDTEDALALGIRHAALNVNLGDFMMEYPEGANTIYFRFDGEDYYIRKSIAEHTDGCIRPLSDAGVTVNLILLNAPAWLTQVSERFWKKIAHPTYEEEGNIALFDVMTEEGCRYYRAFVAFLAQRYTREDAQFGRAVGMIIGNEVNSQWIWANAGDVPFGDYAAQYTSALRIAWQTASAVYAHIRVYASLDHFWAGKMDPASPTRFYSGRDLLAAVSHCCELEGNFPWHVAHHPYPQDLFRADFWHDDTAPHSPDACRVTFQNLDVLRDFLALPEMQYRGESRHIILSEQGFHSGTTPTGEALQAEAFRRAWKIVQEMPQIDSFIYHAHRDNPDEGGLLLGLRRLDGSEKPIYGVFKEM